MDLPNFPLATSAHPASGETARREPSVAVLIPIYRNELSSLERWSLAYSLERLQARDVYFIGPRRLDPSAYLRDHPTLRFVPYDDVYFASVQGYSALLLSPSFYEGYAEQHSHMLILQTDALLLRDDLDDWMASPYDYLGAPWPGGIELRVNVDAFGGSNGRNARARVGNGGFSLRRNAACLDLLREFPQAAEVMRRSGSNEDLFFGLLGSLSRRFVLPNEIVASTFALELQPEHYLAVNGGVLPTGCHAWAKYDPAFWVDRLGIAPPLEAGTRPGTTAVGVQLQAHPS